jgi:predicted MPP superfamily phosphohydrolase
MVLKMRRFAAWVAIGLALLVGAYGFFIEPQMVKVSHVTIRDPGFREVLGEKVVVHLSDLHIKEFGLREERLLGFLDKLQPDLIFLTGDYVQWNGDYETPLNFLSKLRAKIGVWAVMGDYDYSRSRKSCLFCHEEGGGMPSKRHKVKFLRNGIERIDLSNRTVWIRGVELEDSEGSLLRETVSAWKEKQPAIILSHNPLNFDFLDENQDVLMLAGDTHGGQISVPSWFWKLLGYEKNAKYPEGLFEKGRKKMVVSRGIGTSHIPFRLFRRPEVVVLHFE